MSLTKLSVLGLFLISLSACNDSSSGGGPATPANPELQKAPLETWKETAHCTYEEMTLWQLGNGQVYYEFSKSASDAVRMIGVYENSVKKQTVEGSLENSTCQAFQDTCNQPWYKESYKNNAETIVRVTYPTANLRKETNQSSGTRTLVQTDYNDPEHLNKPEPYSVNSEILERVEGNLRYLIESSNNGKKQSYNEAFVTEITGNEIDRTEVTTLAKPFAVKEGNNTITTLKSYSSCTYHSEKVQP